MHTELQLQLVEFKDTTLEGSPFLLSMEHLLREPDMLDAETAQSLLLLAMQPLSEGIDPETKSLAVATMAKICGDNDPQREQYYRQVIRFMKLENIPSFLRIYASWNPERPLAIAMRQDAEMQPSN